MSQQQAELDKQQYKEALDDFVLLCDLWGARRVLEDIRDLYPETYQQIHHGFTSIANFKKVAALLRK